MSNESISLHKFIAIDVDIACEFAKALINSILCIRCLQNVALREKILQIGTNDISYAQIDDVIVQERIGDCLANISQILHDDMFGIVQLDVSFGTLTRAVRSARHVSTREKQKKPQKASKWAAWLTNTLSSVVTPENEKSLSANDLALAEAKLDCKLLHDADASVVWEKWSVHIYVAPPVNGVNEESQTLCFENAVNILTAVQEFCQKQVLPSPCALDNRPYPFRLVARSATRSACAPKSLFSSSPSRPLNVPSNRRSQFTRSESDSSGSGWWSGFRLSPTNSDRLEAGLDLLRDVVGSAPAVSSSPPF